MTVSGTTVQIDVETLSVEDSLIDLARNNSTSDTVDIGLYGLYDTTGSQDVYGGLFRDASDSGKWKLFKDLQAEPTNTVDVTGTGYATGTLVANVEGNVTGDVTGAASKVAVIADNNTNSTNNITFVNAASGDRQVRTDNQLTYNPSTGTLAAGNIQGSLFGNLIGNVTGNISGNVTGTITGDTSGNSGTATALQNSRNFTVGSTDVAFDGSADADLTEAVQDTVGAMFSSNTENGVTATYEDVDGTVDLTVTALYNGTTKQLETTSTGLEVFGHIIPDTTESYDLGSPTKRFRKGYFDAGTIFLGTQELTADSAGISVSGNFTANNITGTLTGNATGTASSLATSRNITIGSVAHAFDGSADVDLTEAIQDTVGAMFSSNTETNITATYQDSDGTIDLAVTAASSAGGVTSGGSVVTTSDSAPSSPNDGALWFDTTGLKMYVYYADGSSSQWVESTPGAGASSGAAAVSISETGPSTPDQGALWFDPSDLTPYIYYNDGNSSQWIEFTPGGGGGSSSGLTIQDEGSALSTDATTLNFVGTGVTVTGSGATKTVTVSSGSSLTVAAGAGLTGGGSSGTVTLNAIGGTGITVNADSIEADMTAIRASIDGSDLDMSGNKVLFGNMYAAESDLPSASTYHGMFAHVHATGKGYFAHDGAWKKLLDESSSTTADLAENTNLYYTDARADARIAAADTDNLSEGSTNLYYTDARAQAVSINNVVEDTTPELGGNLDLGTNSIVTASDRNLTLAPDGTGKVVISSPLQVGVFTLPETDGTANQVLITDGSGTLTWGDPPATGTGVETLRTHGVLTTVTGNGRWYVPADAVITKIVARVNTAPTGAPINLVINKVSGGTTTTTNMSIAAAGYKSENNSPSLSLSYDDYITVDVTQVGSSEAGRDLQIIFTYTY